MHVRVSLILLSIFVLLSTADGSDTVARLEQSVSFEQDFSNRPIPRYANKFLTTTDHRHGRVTIWDTEGR